MAAKKYAVPNWAQAVLAQAVGLDPANVSVAHEDDRTISFQQYQPYCTVLIGKVDGSVIREGHSCGNQ